MSLITRCPTCETLFRVVPDQLRVSDGWVRCGQCDEIFDASLHLLATSLKEAAPAVHPEPPALKLDATVSLDNASQPIFVRLDSDSDSLQSALEDGDNGDFEESELEGNAETDEASFLRHDKSESFWSRPFVRTALTLLVLLLLLGLSGQIVFHERDRILAMQPQLRPWLVALCESLHCTLSPLRQIEFITIDSSSFVKIGADVYRLNVTLKNNGNAPLAMPAIELTLTDSQDQPVVRHVFLASELDAKSNTLVVGVDWTTSLVLALKASSDPNKVVGYRLLAFYP